MSIVCPSVYRKCHNVKICQYSTMYSIIEVSNLLDIVNLK